MPVFTLDVPSRLLPVVAAILREKGFPEDDDGETQVAITREQGCSVEDFVAAEHCLDALKTQVEAAARARGARRAR